MQTPRQHIQPSILGNSPALIRHCRYKRFGFKHGSVLVIASGYHLVNDSVRAFLSQQWGVKLLQLQPVETFISRFFEAIALHKPDFLFTINHIGFDNGGALTRILEEIEMPFVSWFVDQPEFILLNHQKNASSWGVTPVWEKAGLEFLEQFGFPNSFYLPLAGSSKRLMNDRATKAHQYGVSFVGDSLQAGAMKWRMRCESETDLGCLIDPVVEKLLENRLQKPIELAKEISAESASQISATPAHHLAIFSSAVCKEASRRQRLAMAETLADEQLDIFGDDGWRGNVPDQVKLYPPVDYNDELFSVYNASMINLNVTNFQMPTAVNQRVFDVPLAGGFLLTDHQADLDDLFDAENEVVSYRSAEEALEKVCYYKRNSSARENIINHARTKIMAEHTYDKRIAAILLQVRDHYRMMCGSVAQVF